MSPHGGRARGPLFRVDPGWLFLFAGAVLLISTVLIPAMDDLAEAKWERDRALAVERHRTKRLENYAAYIDAIKRRDPTLVQWLAATQLNLMPTDKQIILPEPELLAHGGAPFGDLEPPPELVRDPVLPDSILHRLATNERVRLWVIAIGAMSMLVGLLPTGKRRPAHAPEAQNRPGVEGQAATSPIATDAAA